MSFASAGMLRAPPGLSATASFSGKRVELCILSGRAMGKDQQKYDLKTDPDGFPPQPTSDFHTSDKFKLIAQGKAPDMTIQSFQHIRIDKNNNVVADQEKSPVVKCSGGK
jgi:hypothetical protein